MAAAAATQLAVVDPSENLLSGSPFSLTVNAEDPYGNVDSSFSWHDVTLALASNPGGATLGGTLTTYAYNGVATFSDRRSASPAAGTH